MKSLGGVRRRPLDRRARTPSVDALAVVTGGGRGLGKAIVQRLCEAGASVLIGDINKDLASKAAADLALRYGEAVLGTFVDVAQTACMTAAAEQAVKTLAPSTSGSTMLASFRACAFLK